MHVLKPYKINPAACFAGISGLILLAYCFTRAASLSVTHDEALTYLRYATASWKDLIGLSGFSANNHLLNTILVKLLLYVTGPSEWALRLPALAEHFLYLFFAYRFAALLKNPW